MGNIVLRLSTGSATSTTGSNPANSIGGKMSSDPTAVINESNNTLNNLFDNVSKSENYAGSVEYRCVYIHNDTSVQGESVSAIKLYIEAGSKAAVEVAIEGINSDAKLLNAETDTIGILSSLTFTSPTSLNKLDIGNLDPGSRVPLWIKRTVNNIVGSGTIQDVIGIVIEGVE